MHFIWTIALVGCTAEPSTEQQPRLPTATVQQPRFVDCVLDASGEYSLGVDWVPYLTRRRTHDEWGNIAYEYTEDRQGARSELFATFHGRWPLEREIVDTFSSPVTEERDAWSWDGETLLERASTWGATEVLTTYDSDGSVPYERAELDYERDGTIEQVTTYEWADGRVVLEQSDDDADGNVDRTWRYAYDAAGHLTEREYEEAGGLYDHLEQEWGGPNDNLLSSRREIGDGGIPTVTFQQIDWTADWRTSTTSIFMDGELFEVDSNEYDPAGRLQSWVRDFPSGAYASTREVWTWTCP